MNPILLRWLRFNAVGLLGMALQLGLLAALNHWLPGHPLLWTALALETTVLHNFLWHRRYTWRTRGRWWPQLLRFHAANGAVSLAGNLLLVRLLVQTLPVVASNLVAIVCCSLANFALGHLWAFRPPDPRPSTHAST